jgi:lipid II:glycine glycyltransferase (peptidoglycan interpeptide bridge formation enzyme)
MSLPVTQPDRGVRSNGAQPQGYGPNDIPAGASTTPLQPRETNRECRVEVDAIDEAHWYDLLEQFEDANIYQTWAYEQARSSREGTSRIVVRWGEEVIALAQVRIVKVPLLTLGIAYVRWGPVWRRRGRAADPEIFRLAMRALRQEYVEKRGLTMRVLPLLFRDCDSAFESMLAEEGFVPVPHDRPDRTLLLDVNRPLSEVRAGLRSHWKRCLKSAEKNNLEIVEGTGEDVFQAFVGIYRELLTRKKFPEPNNIEEFVAVQRALPERFKMRIRLCKSAGTVCAGLVSSAVGNTAVYLFGATGDSGLKVGGSYLLHWNLIETLIRSGVPVYDLNGINPVKNPGTHRFKAELCGDKGRDTFFLGRFESHPGRINRSCIRLVDGLRAASRSLRSRRLAS